MNTTDTPTPENQPTPAADTCQLCGIQSESGLCRDCSISAEEAAAAPPARETPTPLTKSLSLSYKEDSAQNPCIFWVNPYNGTEEIIARVFWPTHPPEKTEEVEAIWDCIWNQFVSQNSLSKPITSDATFVTKRLDSFLTMGGLYHSDMANHDAASGLMLDARNYIATLERRLADAEAGAAALREAVEKLILRNPVGRSHEELDGCRKALATEAGEATLKELQALQEMRETVKDARPVFLALRAAAKNADRAAAAIAERDDARAKLADAQNTLATLEARHLIDRNDVEDTRARLKEAERMLVQSQLDILSVRKEAEAKLKEAEAERDKWKGFLQDEKQRHFKNLETERELKSQKRQRISELEKQLAEERDEANLLSDGLSDIANNANAIALSLQQQLTAARALADRLGDDKARFDWLEKNGALFDNPYPHFKLNFKASVLGCHTLRAAIDAVVKLKP